MDRKTGPAPVPTKQQSRPLEVQGASVALSAGAGCGKTMVLTLKFMKDLEVEHRRPLREVVALTFTEKAARELRQRIRERCREKLASVPEAEPEHWRSVLRGLEAAPIGTFHSVCGQWLRRHAIEAKIDPDFSVLDESIAAAIRDEALAKCVRRWLAAADPDLIELAVDFGLGRARAALADLMSQRALGDIDAWRDRAPEDLIAIWRSVWEREGRQARFLDKVVPAARACVSTLSPHEPTHPKMRARRAFLLSALTGLESLNPSDAWLAEVQENAKVQGGGTKDHWPSPEIYKQVQDSLTALRAGVKAFQDGSKWDEEATREAAEHGLRFARLAVAARAAYDLAKQARGGLDYDDLIVKTRDLLRRRPEGEELPSKETIARLLVDEFQDTDPVQAEILERLAGPGVESGRLFLVGDFKQSIYRFRGARPEIFQEFRKRFPEAGRLALTENFRSTQGVLDFVNALFADRFPDRDDLLVPGIVLEAAELEPEPAVEFLWAVETNEESADATHAADRRRVEARWLARRVRRRIDAGWIVRDRKTQERRPAHAGDVVFLLRALTDVRLYADALDEEGLDYHIIGGASYFVQEEVRDLVNLLSVVEDPCDTVALAGALRGPFFCLSDEGLFSLATSRPGGLAEGLEQVEEVAELAPLDRRHAERARTLLRRWREIKDRVPIAALVDRALDESGYEAALLGESFGPRKRANARKLVRLARRFDQEGGFTIAAFVAGLRADLRKPPREDQAATTDEEGTSVRLMSIHQAKGLEFPIVVLPDLNRKPQGNDRGLVAFHPVLGPLVRPSKDREDDLSQPPEGQDSRSRQSLGWLTYQAIEQREEEAESIRLLYVATTRARDALILSSGHGPSEKPISPALTLIDQRFDRATGACRGALPEGCATPRVRVAREVPSSPTERPARSGGRPALDEIAATIAATPLVSETAPPPAPRVPRYVALDPSRGLAERAGRLDRLVRSILADPKALQPGGLPAVAARAGRRQDPVASGSLISEATDRLRPYLEGMIGRDLAAATAMERNLDWTASWPPNSLNATVFSGRIDMLARDRSGAWRLFQWSDADAPEQPERLRLLLSAHAANALGFGPIVRAWHLRLGPEGGGGLRAVDEFDGGAIDAALNEWLAARL